MIPSTYSEKYCTCTYLYHAPRSKLEARSFINHPIPISIQYIQRSRPSTTVSSIRRTLHVLIRASKQKENASKKKTKPKTKNHLCRKSRNKCLPCPAPLCPASLCPAPLCLALLCPTLPAFLLPCASARIRQIGPRTAHVCVPPQGVERDVRPAHPPCRELTTPSPSPSRPTPPPLLLLPSHYTQPQPRSPRPHPAHTGCR